MSKITPKITPLSKITTAVTRSEHRNNGNVYRHIEVKSKVSKNQVWWSRQTETAEKHKHSTAKSSL